MAVLGHGGRLKLRREAPEPLVLSPDALHLQSSSLMVSNPAYWSGDPVTLVADRGLPIALEDDAPACPDGYAMYGGSDWLIPPHKPHMEDDDSPFYLEDDNAPFYVNEDAVGDVSSATYYIYRDQLDRISFYTSRAAALRGNPQDRMQLYRVDFGSLILAPFGTLDYQNALAVCAGDLGDYKSGDAIDEVTLKSVCSYAPDYQSPAADDTDYSNASLSTLKGLDWLIQADLREWSLTLTASEVDTTAVGERFGDAVKSIVTGGGTMDFLINRADFGDGHQDSTALLALVLLLEKGCKASAQFVMVGGRPETDSHLLAGDLYYESQLLITSNAINTRADDIIAGSLNFVTVGEIALRMGTN